MLHTITERLSKSKLLNTTIDWLNKTHDLLQRNLLFKIISVFILLGVATFWIYCTDKYAVNILFWDQWDYYDPPLNELNFIEIFVKQHGPPRLGIGFLLTQLIDYLSDMNMRTISFVVAILIFISAWCYYQINRKLFKDVSAFSLVIFLIALAPSQIMLHTSNISHGAMPALLISFYCGCFLIKNYYIRSLLILIINFNMIFSGFGIFLGVITPFLFAGEFFYFIKTKDLSKRLFTIFSFFVTLFSFYLFSIDYVFMPAVDNFVFPHPRPFEYIEFMALAYANFFGRAGSGNFNYILGYITLLVLLIILFKNIVFVFKNRFDTSKNEVTISKIIVILIGYSIVFILNAAVGRVSIGTHAAQIPRYMPYLVPSFLAIFFYLNTIRTKHKNSLIVLFFVAMFSLVFSGKLETHGMKHFHANKKAWKDNYLMYEDIEKADELTNFKIHPNAKGSNLKQKLEYLKKNKLSLYNETDSIK